MDMRLFDIEPMVREMFRRVGCLPFCQNMQRGHLEVEKQFALNFDGKKTRVGDLEFEVTKASISAAIGIPISGENWFKAMVLSSPFVKDLFKPEYQANDLSNVCSISYIPLIQVYFLSTFTPKLLVEISQDLICCYMLALFLSEDIIISSFFHSTFQITLILSHII